MMPYIIKRLLIMIPTFFVISCVVFLVLNLAPGRPTPIAGDTEGTIDPSQTQESFKIFNQQFHFDKPILFNTRFALSKQQVAEAIAYETSRLNKDDSLRQDYRYFSKLNQARDDLQDWGLDSVPHLMSILQDSKSPLLRFTTVKWLSANAQQPLQFDYSSEKAQDLYLEENQKIEVENNRLRNMQYASQASPQEIQRVVNEWQEWYRQRSSSFQRSWLDKIVMFFTDTRLAYYWRNLLCLDFGISHVSKRRVLPTVFDAIQYSVCISLVGIILAYVIAVPIGIFSAVKRGSKADTIMTVILFMLYALPSFFLSTLALRYLADPDTAIIRLFPVGGFHSPDYELLLPHQKILDICWHLTLPIAMFTYGSLAALSRYARAGLLEVVNADYIRTARAKGLNERIVVMRHMVRNGMIPILTLLGTLLPAAISGSIVIENIFNIHGIGWLMVDSITKRDYNMIMCISLVSSALTLIGILLSDISYALLDPRIRYR